MLCFRYRRLLVPYSEGELDQRLREKLERHLAVCADCALDLGAIRSVFGALSRAEQPSVEPAPDLWAKVSARIADVRPEPARRPWLRAPQAVSAAAAAVLIAAVGFNMIHSSLRTPPEVRPPESPAVERPESAAAPSSKPSDREAAKPAERTPESAAVAPVRPAGARKARSVVRHPAAPEPNERPALVMPKPTAASGTWLRGTEPAEERTRAYSGPTGGAATMGRPGRDGKLYHADGSRDEAGVAATEGVAPMSEPAPELGTVSVADRPEIRRGTASAPDAAAAPVLGRGYVDCAPLEVRSRVAAGVEMHSYDADHLTLGDAALVRGPEPSVVDTLTETEGVRTAALFAYP